MMSKSSLVESKNREQQDNEAYSTNFARIPNILFVSYKYLTKEEKFLYCTLKSIYWDAKPRYVSLAMLNEATGYSTGALSKMLPRLHACNLIHAEIRREKVGRSKETGKAKYYITILDIWEVNRKYFASPLEERDQLDPSLVLCSPNERKRSPNEQSTPKIVHQMNENVHQMNDLTPLKPPVEGSDASPKDSLKDIEERTNDTSAQSTGQENHSIIHSIALSPEEMILALQAQGYIVTPPSSAPPEVPTSEPVPPTVAHQETIPAQPPSKSPATLLSEQAQGLLGECSQDPVFGGIPPDVTEAGASTLEYLAKTDPQLKTKDFIKMREAYQSLHQNMVGWHIANYKKAHKLYVTIRNKSQPTPQKNRRRPLTPQERAALPV